MVISHESMFVFICNVFFLIFFIKVINFNLQLVHIKSKLFQIQDYFYT